MADFWSFLAVEAVIGEPVSASHFPVSRENTGKFLEFEAGDGDAALTFTSNSRRSVAIP
jgi:hypothetical protein